MIDFRPLPTNIRQQHHASYAGAAVHNVPPLSRQLHADKNLLCTGPSPTCPTTAPDVENKVSLVPHDWATHSTAETSLHTDVTQSESDIASHDDADADSGSTKRRARKQRERRHKMSKSKRDVQIFWCYPRPGLIGGVMSFRAYFLPRNTWT